MSEKQKTKQELPNRAHSHTVKNKSKATGQAAAQKKKSGEGGGVI
jgi:hypothetical protein